MSYVSIDIYYVYILDHGILKGHEKKKKKKKKKTSPLRFFTTDLGLVQSHQALVQGIHQSSRRGDLSVFLCLFVSFFRCFCCFFVFLEGLSCDIYYGPLLSFYISFVGQISDAQLYLTINSHQNQTSASVLRSSNVDFA